jgi:hypothetical protein
VVFKFELGLGSLLPVFKLGLLQKRLGSTKGLELSISKSLSKVNCPAKLIYYFIKDACRVPTATH